MALGFAPDERSGTETNADEKQDANIATVIEGMSDDCQSSVASSQVSGLTGLTGMMSDDAGTDGRPAGGDDGGGPSRDSDSESRASDSVVYLPNELAMTAPESFQTEYQTRSAMARLNLGKDMLHAASEVNGGGARTVGPQTTVAMEDTRRKRGKKEIIEISAH